MEDKSADYVAVLNGMRELDRLWGAGKEDSQEADAIRDALDEPWGRLSLEEREQVKQEAIP